MSKWNWWAGSETPHKPVAKLESGLPKVWRVSRLRRATEGVLGLG